jgi:glycosyl transferase family 25
MTAMTARTAGALDALFPLQVCINLDRRPDRWGRVRERFARHGLGRVGRIPAVDGAGLEPPPGWQHPRGAFGCLLSHLEAVRQARREGVPQVLIFEDDVVLHPDLHERFAAGLEELPEDWDMLYFGAIHDREPERVSRRLARLTRSYSTFAYALRHTVYDAFLDLNGRFLTQVDHANLMLQERFRCYGFLPHLAWVEEDLSDAQGGPANHWYLEHSVVFKGAEMEEACRRAAAVFPYRTDHTGFMVEHYLRCLPGAQAVVVNEEGGLRSLGAAALRECPRAELFLLADPSLFLERPDLSAAVVMCRRRGSVLPCREVLELDAESTRRVLARERFERPPLPSLPVSPGRGGPVFLDRRTLRRWLHETPDPAPAVAFQAPARALRLGAA